MKLLNRRSLLPALQLFNSQSEADDWSYRQTDLCRGDPAGSAHKQVSKELASKEILGGTGELLDLPVYSQSRVCNDLKPASSAGGNCSMSSL